jgi:hypothetical protein
MNENFTVLKNGQIIINSMKETIEDIRRSLPDFINKFYHEDEMRKIDKMVIEAKSKVRY